MPYYKVNFGEREQMVPIEDLNCKECPTSLLDRHTEMETLVRRISSSKNVNEAFGASPFGLDASRWPSRFYDMVSIFIAEERRVDKAIEKYSKSLG